MTSEDSHHHWRRGRGFGIDNAAAEEARCGGAENPKSSRLLVASSFPELRASADKTRPCKTRKIKCGEERPGCINCERQGDICDYSIRLNWEGRSKRRSDANAGPASASSGFINVTSPQSNRGGKRKSFQYASKLQSPSNLDSQYAVLSPRPAPQISPTTQDRQSATALTSSAMLSLPSLIQSTSSSSDTESPSPGCTARQSSIARDQFSAAQLSRFRDHPFCYPSPTESSNESSPPVPSGPASAPLLLSANSPRSLMPPPSFQNPSHHNSPNNDEYNPGARIKRARFHSAGDIGTLIASRDVQIANGRPSNFSGNPGMPVPTLVSFDLVKETGPGYATSALTPGTSVASDELHNMIGSKALSQQPNDPNAVRRLSVKSLLADENDELDRKADAASPDAVYGIDHGFPDHDLPKNNDSTALEDLSPTTYSRELTKGGTCALDIAEAPAEFGFGLYGANNSVQGDGYYRQPIIVSIPRTLGALPQTLLDNPMNLLYFHHFLNHTARILAPHDCNGNPFRSILPRMALMNKHLLNLLLAYSASHRARHLKQPEPANRIALWVQDIFPSLSKALDDPTEQLSDANLATAIMLASLEIISPNTFEVPISWQVHLHIARQLILARGVTQPTDQISYFLSRWFAYLDILGSLSGGRSNEPLSSGKYWISDDQSTSENDFQIDCLTGFTSRCVVILAKVAELARECDRQRVNDRGEIDHSWRASEVVRDKAERLRIDLRTARLHKYQGCPHRNPDPAEDLRDSREMAATNDAFHWAGLIHLDRRVLGKTSDDAEVQLAVNKIINALDKIRRGGTAEASLVFPMFTAGCEATEEEERSKILERIQNVESSGMTQVREARMLMERVWDTGMPWEMLVAGEFVG